MQAIIYICKIIAIALMAYRCYVLIAFKIKRKNVQFKLELMSRIELFAGIGVFLVAVFSKTEESYYIFSLILNVCNVLLVATHSYRIVVASDDEIILNLKEYRLKNITGMNATTFTLHVFLKKGKEIKIVAPLTSNETVKKMKYV